MSVYIWINAALAAEHTSLHENFTLGLKDNITWKQERKNFRFLYHEQENAFYVMNYW